MVEPAPSSALPPFPLCLGCSEVIGAALNSCCRLLRGRWNLEGGEGKALCLLAGICASGTVLVGTAGSWKGTWDTWASPWWPPDLRGFGVLVEAAVW